MKTLMLAILLTRQILCVDANFNKLFPPLQTELERNLTRCTNRLLHDLANYTHLAFSHDGLLIDNIAHAVTNTRVANLKLNGSLPRIKVSRELIIIVIEEKGDLVRYLGSISAGADTCVDYFIIYLGKESMEEIFEIIWLNKMTKVIVLDKFNNFYSYRPYEDGCNTIKPRFQFNCLNANHHELVNIFNYQLKTLYDCPVRAMALINPPYVIDDSDRIHAGYETRMYQTAAKVLNFKLNFVKHNHTAWGFKEEDFENYTHLLAEFQKDLHIDIMFGRLPARARILADFETTNTYYHNLVTFFVPTARPIDPIRNVINVFDWKVWFLINIVFFSLNLIIFCLNRLKLINSKYFSYINIVGISVSQSVQPPSGLTLKFFYIVWVVYTLVLTASFSSALISFLTKPAYEKQINSVEDILRAQLVIGGNIYAEPLVPRKNSTFVFCQNFQTANCIFRVAFKRDMALIEDVHVVKYHEFKFKRRNIKADIYKIAGEQHEHYIWAIVRRGHPLGKMMNKLILLFKQAGFVNKWRSMFKIRREKSVGEGYAVITFNHLRLSFCIYGVGISVCLVVFFWEIRRNITRVLKNFWIC